MKKLTGVAILLTIVSTQVIADDGLCKEIHGLADTVVEAMQSGVTLPRMMEIAGDNLNGKKVILDAYSHQSLLSTKESRSIFANKWYMICLKTDMGIK